MHYESTPALYQAKRLSVLRKHVTTNQAAKRSHVAMGILGLIIGEIVILSLYSWT
jgi:hypothetical protein